MNKTIFQDAFSEEVWNLTYKNSKDTTIDDMFIRVAKSVATMEKTPKEQQYWEHSFIDLLSDFKFTAGGRIYSNAGTDWQGTSLFNCFVSPRASSNIDSLNGILMDVQNQARTLKAEGGWGQNFSFIRPRGAPIISLGIDTPGSVKYMELYDKSSDVITSGSGKDPTLKHGKKRVRKGAQMSILDIWHPDIIEFITAKQQPGRLTKFNMSVNCTDKFMNTLLHVLELKQQSVDISIIEEADKWPLVFPDTTFEKYDAEWDGDILSWENKNYPVKVYQTVSCTWLWNLIMESTYDRAEPGILFIDRANYYNPLNYKEKISACNPCAEQMLAPGGCCNLGSINLTQFVDIQNSTFDFDNIKKYLRIAVRFLDNINDLSNAPLPDYKHSMIHKRRIGLGVMGWGSALYMLRIRFGSKQASNLRDKLMEVFATEAYKASIDLATERGMFSLCEPEKHANSPFIQGLNLSDDYMYKLSTTGIRNSSLLSCQPTGNTSILANIVSGGIEPVFMAEYTRTVIVTAMPEHIAAVTPKWYEGEWKETEMFKKTKEGDEEILKGVDNNGVVYKIDTNRGLTKEVPCEDYGVRFLKERGQWDPKAEWAITAMELTTDAHVNDLNGFARWVDSSISKTINVPNNYPFEDFKNIYLDAYKTGYIKGITTYRSGTMTTVLSAKDEKTADNSDEEIIKEEVKLPDSAPASMKTLKAEGRKYYVTVVYYENNINRPFALFVKSNHHESNTTTSDAVDVLLKLAKKKKIPKKHIDDVEIKIASDNNANKTARAISLLLRHGVLIKNIVAALDHVEDVFVGSFIFQIKKFLSAYIKDGEKVEDEKCSECSGQIVFSQGCKSCVNCSNSKCS